MNESKKYKMAIGGIEVTPEEKEDNLYTIKEAIEDNNLGYPPTKISYQVFAKSYPESLKLIKAYYDSLYYAKLLELKEQKSWDGHHYVNKNNKIKALKSKINQKKIETLIIFAPELMKMDVIKIREMLDISTIEINSIFNHYKKIINNVSKIDELDEEQEKYNIAKLIYKEIVINGMKKQTFCSKYKISDSTIDSYIELLKEIDVNLYKEVKETLGENVVKRYHALKTLIDKIGTYCQEKIKITTENEIIEIPFTILDYYSITNYSTKSLLDFIRNPQNFNPNNREEMVKRSIVQKRIQTQRNVGPFVSREQILKNNLVGGKSTNPIKMTETICDEIFKLFEQENIPKNKILIETAFRRYALGQPILPLKMIENIKILTENEQVELDEKTGPIL